MTLADVLRGHGAPCELTEHIASDLRVVGTLGTGTHGCVYRVVDGAERAYAVKVHFVPNTRTKREASILSDLHGSAVVPDLCLDAVPQNKWCIAMELVPHTLADILPEAHGIPVLHACVIARELVRMLDTVHERRYVHCDLKTNNIGVRDDGTMVFFDFGLAVRINAFGTVQHRLPWRVGQEVFMHSPSTVSGCTPGRHDDFWALLAVILELLLGGGCGGAAQGIYEPDRRTALRDVPDDRRAIVKHIWERLDAGRAKKRLKKDWRHEVMVVIGMLASL